MRVTAGSGKGRKLKVPSGGRVRPTADKVKQALFNILGDLVQDAVFLDLYAGTGGIGVDALSRGASRAVFVDDSRDSLKAIQQNLESAGLKERATIIAAKAESFLKRAPEQFDIIFLDPPYTAEQPALLELVSGSAVLKDGSIVISEHFKKQRSPERQGMLVLYREAVYGDTVLAFYRKSSDFHGNTDS